MSWDSRLGADTVTALVWSTTLPTTTPSECVLVGSGASYSMFRCFTLTNSIEVLGADVAEVQVFKGEDGSRSSVYVYDYM